MCTKNLKETKRKIGRLLPKVEIKRDIKDKFPILEEEIVELRKRNKEKLLFSFKFFDREHEAFNLGNTGDSWFIALMDSLKEVSNLTRNDLVVVQRQHYQAHNHKWEDLDYCYSLADIFLEQVECLQFRLSTSGGRVHGFIIGNNFYIVWLDPHHNLYPDDRFGGRNFYTKPLTCYEKIVIELEYLKSKLEEKDKCILEMEELLDIKTSPNS